MKNDNKFNYYEKLLFKIHLGIVGFGMIMFILLMVFIDSLENVANEIAGFMYTIMFVEVIGFFVSIIRILKYLFSTAELKESRSIWRSVIIMLTSPIASGLYFLVMFVMLLSTASCTLQ